MSTVIFHFNIYSTFSISCLLYTSKPFSILLLALAASAYKRKDHPQVMNAAVRLYADAANAKTKMENGLT